MLGNIYTLKLTSLAHDGRALGRIDETAYSSTDIDDFDQNSAKTGESTQRQGQVIFVSGALPGQKVRARITKSKKTFAEATCLELLEQSPESRAAACVHGTECGGCPLQAMPYATQLFWKERMIKDALMRIGKLPDRELLNIQSIIPSPSEWFYRNKMEFAFANDSSQKHLKLGLRAKGTHDVVSVPYCKLMPKSCMQVLEELRQKCQALQLKAWDLVQCPEGVLRHAVIRCTESDEKNIVLMLITAHTGKTLRAKIGKMGQELLDDNPNLMAFVHEERKSRTLFAEGENLVTVLGNSTLHQKLGGIEYEFGHDSFFQINAKVADKLAFELVDMQKYICNGNNDLCLWDIYCGVGAPGLSFADKVSSIYGVEINPKAIAMAKVNAQNLQMAHCRYFVGDAKKVVQKWPQPHLVLMDPPRMGLHPEVLAKIIQAQPKHIIYISCNPASLARDLALLKKDYFLNKLIPLDFFPQTAHVESCAVLTLRKCEQ